MSRAEAAAFNAAQECAARGQLAKAWEAAHRPDLWVCRCDHPHPAGAAWCYLCEYPLPDPSQPGGA